MTTGHLVYAAAQEHSKDLRERAQRASIGAQERTPLRVRLTARVARRRAALRTKPAAAC